MKKKLSQRWIAGLLAVVMVVLAIPFGVISVFADPMVDSNYVITTTGSKLLYSYNALSHSDITSKNADLKSATEIFNREKLKELYGYASYAPMSGQQGTVREGKDMYEFAQSANVSMSYSVGGNLGIGKLFKFSVEAKFKDETSEFYSQAKEAYFYEYLVQMQKGYFSLNEYYIQDVSRNPEAYLSEPLLNALKNVDETNAAEFLAEYGTHVILGYTVGGEASVTVSSAYTKEVKEEEVKKAYSTGAGLDSPIASNITIGVSTALDMQSAIKSKETTDGYTYIGDTFAAGGNDAIAFSESSDGKTTFEYTDWANSVTAENGAVLLDNRLKMIPIWTLFPQSEYQKQISALMNAYLQDAEQQDNDFFWRYGVKDSDALYDYSEDWVNFADCKIITNEQELNDIRNDLNGVYVLANNIVLSNYADWTPIGTETEPFRGRLYGNYNTISGLAMNATISTDEHEKTLIGLFGYNDGLITDLKVSGSITTPTITSPNVYIGAMAGINGGIINNCYDDVTYHMDATVASYLNLPLREINLDTATEKTITIEDEIGVKLIGTAGTTYSDVNIVVADSDVSSPVYVMLENASITGSSSDGTIYDPTTRALFLISAGTENSIKGATDAAAVHVPNADVYAIGDAPLTITGGDGSDGANGADIYPKIGGRSNDGENGHDGGIAVICNSLTVNTTASLYLYGGNGGNGGNGGGYTCRENFDGQPKLGAGGNGGNGGNGGAAIMTEQKIDAALDLLSCTSFYAQPGNGGNGGQGGQGCGVLHKSEYDGNPDHVNTWAPDHGGNGGNGGTGGNGYVAGNGGNGGKGGYTYGRKDKPRYGITGDGGQGGNSGTPVDAFDGTLYYLGTEGSAGAGGSCGDRDEGEKYSAYYGANGSSGSVTAAVKDAGKTYGDTFVEGNHSQIYKGDNMGANYHICSTGGTLRNVNQPTWNDNLLQIESVSKTEYFSGDTLDISTLHVYMYGKEISNYAKSYNFKVKGTALDTMAIVEITKDDYSRNIPVHVSKVIPDHIEIYQAGKTEFAAGETFDVSGLCVRVVYNNDSQKLVSESDRNSNLTWTTPSTALAGTSDTVKVVYEESGMFWSASYAIDVVQDVVEKIVIKSADGEYKTLYYQGEELNTDGLAIYATYKSGKVTEVKNNLTFSLSQSLHTVGTSTVTVTYNAKFDDPDLNVSYPITILAKKGFDHTWDSGTETLAPTHTTTGIMTYTCTADGCDATKTSSIPRLEGHTYGAWHKLNETQHRRECACGDTITQEHTWDSGKETLSPTHTTTGIKTYICTADGCGATKTEVIDKIPAHSFGDWTSCDETRHHRTCVCGQTEYADHDWNETILVEPTYTTEGEAVKVCSVCGDKQTVVLPMLELDEDTPVIEIEQVRTVPGAQVEVKIELKNNPGIASMKLQLTYDESILTLKGIRYGASMGGMSQQPETMDSPVLLNWYNGAANTTGDHVYATLVFAVKKEAPLGSTAITVTYDPEDVYSVDYRNVSFATVAGEVAILNHTPGDINGDGVVNNKDLSLLSRYLSGWKNLNVNEAALDVNGDGKVNNKDMSLLFQYLSGWDVDIF